VSASLAQRLVYGAAPPAPTPPARRWLRGRGGETLRAGLARLAVGWALRAGGAWPQTVFDAEGARLAHEPLWGPTVRAAADWRLSVGSVKLALELLERPAESELPIVAKPATVADLVLFQAVAERLEREPGGLSAAQAVAAASPLNALLAIDAARWPRPDWAALAPLLSARWLMPYLADHLARRWLAVEPRRGQIQRAEEQTLNGRLATVAEGLGQHCLATAQHEGLIVLVHWLARLWRLDGGLPGILKTARLGLWRDWTQADRERFEAGLGRLFGLAQRLAATAEDLRGLGWQRTAADEAFLGAYSRELEPLTASLTRLHHELCRIV